MLTDNILQCVLRSCSLLITQTGTKHFSHRHKTRLVHITAVNRKVNKIERTARSDTNDVTKQAKVLFRFLKKEMN